MRVTVTLDYYNGEKGKAREMHADELTPNALIMALTSQGVCGITITKHKPLDRIFDIMKKENQETGQ